MELSAANIHRHYVPYQEMSSSRARVERDPPNASRVNKKRKTMAPSVASRSERGAAPGSKRQYDDMDHGESSDDQGEAYETSADRLTRPHQRARTRVSDHDAPTKQQTATWSGRRAVDGSLSKDGASQGEVHRGSGRTRPSKTTHAGSSGNEQDDQRYCFCNNVSYGDMIGCDDDDCEREWFHLGCVGLSKPPQGTWYCDACLERRSQQSRAKTKRNSRPSRGVTTTVVVPDHPASARRITSTRR